MLFLAVHQTLVTHAFILSELTSASEPKCFYYNVSKCHKYNLSLNQLLNQFIKSIDISVKDIALMDRTIPVCYALIVVTLTSSLFVGLVIRRFSVEVQ